MSNNKKQNGKGIGQKAQELALKTPVQIHHVIVNAGSRTYMGMSSMSVPAFDERAGGGRHYVTIHGVVEIKHVSTIDGQMMMNRVSMTEQDHMLALTAGLRVRPDSWYWLHEQDKTSQDFYLALYNKTAKQALQRNREVFTQIEAAKRAAAKAKAEAEEKAKAEAESQQAEQPAEPPVAPVVNKKPNDVDTVSNMTRNQAE